MAEGTKVVARGQFEHYVQDLKVTYSSLIPLDIHGGQRLNAESDGGALLVC